MGTDDSMGRQGTTEEVTPEDDVEGEASVPMLPKVMTDSLAIPVTGYAPKIIMTLSMALLASVLLAVGSQRAGTFMPRRVHKEPALQRFDGTIPNQTSQALLVLAEDCWAPCSGAGICNGYCGEGIVCCRYGAVSDPPECSGISTWSTKLHHTCVRQVTTVKVWHEGQDCSPHCRSGWCEWCGVGNACCKFGQKTDPPMCASVTVWPTWATYTCVAASLKPPGTVSFLNPPKRLACRPGETKNTSGACVSATEPTKMTFYMYQAVSDGDYRVDNVNLASVTGLMWFLHDEVVNTCPRNYGITRITRHVVTVKNTKALWRTPLHYQFGQFVQFYDGKCGWNSSRCDSLWRTYGYVVGCQPLDTTSVSVPNYNGPPAPVWYSLPGICPSSIYEDKNNDCAKKESGGQCVDPDGSSDCTWSVQPAGEIRLDDLEPIVDYTTFCASGNEEYNMGRDSGVGSRFWNSKRDPAANRQRVSKVLSLFQLKYPTYPVSLGDPVCDWYR